MGWLGGSGGARRSGRGTNPIFVEQNQNRFAIDMGKAYIRGIGEARRARAVDHRVGAGDKQGGFQLSAQFAYLTAFLCQMGQGKLRRFSHADDSGNIFRAAAPPALLMTADEQRPEGDSAPDIERTDAFGSVKLVTRYRQKIYGARLEIETSLTRGLDRINVEEDASGFDQSADLLDREDDAGFIVGVHDRNQCSVVGESIAQLVQIQDSVRIDRQPGDAKAFSFQMLA